MNRRADLVAILAIVGVWAVVVALVGVGGDFPLNDDWAYAVSARHLLRTGEIRILQWVAPSLVTHAIWGAGAMRVLGDSHVALRCGTLVWALGALLCLYGLGRSAALGPRAAVVVCLALGLSPWFVNLAFTYMTDVPWLAMMLGALLSFVRALHPRSSESPRPGLLLLSGALVGAAALSRQFAMITTPAFALVVGLDARRRHGARFPWPAARGCLLFGAPVAALFFPFQLWYSRVHGVTQANTEAFERILGVRPWHVAAHASCAIHYVGLWLFPLALALLAERRLGEAVTRRQASAALVVFGGAALALVQRGGLADLLRPDSMIHPLMPYLGNVFFLVGLGPPTLSDVYWGPVPVPHTGVWLGVLLTVASTFGGVVGAGLLWTAARKILRPAPAAQLGGPERSPQAPSGADSRPALVRTLLAGFAGSYLLWHLSTATFLFDRYLLPLLPVVVLLGLDAAPSDLARSPILVACLVGSGLFSAALTREYLSWNDARDRAVRALLARGIAAEDVDGGFEQNGPVHFERFLRRTGKLLEPGSFWVTGAPYRISFAPSRAPDCTTEGRYPYWTWPGGGDPAVYVIHCGSPVAVSHPGPT